MKTQTNLSLKSLTLGVFVITLVSLGCVRMNDKNKNESQKISDIQSSPTASVGETKSTTPLTNQPLRQCLRPQHYLGLKKCARKGKWIRLTLDSRDVDNDRTDVYTTPGMSLKKENFYADSFRIEQGDDPVTNYPDIYKVNAGYGKLASFVFAMPEGSQFRLTYSYWGRDENFSQTIGFDEILRPNLKRVKIQHWNDGSTFKKFANLTFNVVSNYSEYRYRLACDWAEQDQGYDYSQDKTSDGMANLKIPETMVWRKASEKCENISKGEGEFKDRFLGFSDVNNGQTSVLHNFKNDSRTSRKIYARENAVFDLDPIEFNLINPLGYFKVKLDGSMKTIKNRRQEDVTRLEGLYEDDLRDRSFMPQRELPAN